jgi:uncharacterized protein
MSQNSSNKSVTLERTYRWWAATALSLWVLAGFFISQVFVSSVIEALMYFGVSFVGINPSVLNTIAAALIYTLTLVVVIGLPWWVKKRRTTKRDVGLGRLPTWTDIGLAPAGFVIYFLISAVLMYAVARLFPGFNAGEVQDVGFEHLVRYFEYLLAFLTLVIVAPFAEEVLFRGYLYGKLRKAVPIWVAILIVSVLFGFIHGRWNVGIDVFVLSVVMCGLREVTGSIWAGILLHMIKNGLAFYLLFINPMILNTMG